MILTLEPDKAKIVNTNKHANMVLLLTWLAVGLFFGFHCSISTISCIASELAFGTLARSPTPATCGHRKFIWLANWCPSGQSPWEDKQNIKYSRLFWIDFFLKLFNHENLIFICNFKAGVVSRVGVQSDTRIEPLNLRREVSHVFQ